MQKKSINHLLTVPSAGHTGSKCLTRSMVYEDQPRFMLVSCTDIISTSTSEVLLIKLSMQVNMIIGGMGQTSIIGG